LLLGSAIPRISDKTDLTEVGYRHRMVRIPTLSLPGGVDRTPLDGYSYIKRSEIIDAAFLQNGRSESSA
jgi:hypothetical protein